MTKQEKYLLKGWIDETVCMIWMNCQISRIAKETKQKDTSYPIKYFVKILMEKFEEVSKK